MKTIRQHREGRGWTQFALALKAGVQPQAVSLWERGQRLPHVLPLEPGLFTAVLARRQQCWERNPS